MTRAGPRRPPAHPFLVALVPVLALYLNNLDQVALADVLLPGLSALAIAALVYLACGFAVKPVTKAAVLASVLIFLFFTYGHVRIALKTAWPRQSNLSGIVLLGAVVALMALAFYVIRRQGRTMKLASSVMDVVAVVMALTLVVPAVFSEVRATALSRGHSAPHPERSVAMPGTAGAGELPDIYFVVLDRYPGLETARAIYGFDNRPFLDFLRERGFYVAESSRCNYARTDMSLATTLNAEYVGPAYDSIEPRLRRRLLYERIQEGSVWRRLREAGYRTHHLGTWWRPTRANRSADVNVNHGLLSEFFMELYKTTLLYPVGAMLDLDSHREQWVREQVKFAYLDTAVLTNGPVFVFAHFLLPHEPYVFARDGSYQGRLRQMKVGVEDGFAGQLEYTNTRLRKWIGLVLDDTSRKSVIVLQADEGPHPPENFAARESSVTLRARLEILTAYHFPDSDYSALYQSISPVNTFRVLLAKLLGDSTQLVPDASFECVRGRWTAANQQDMDPN
ncbi:MAG: hypothetical protein R6X12_02815 [bacterium]